MSQVPSTRDPGGHRPVADARPEGSSLGRRARAVKRFSDSYGLVFGLILLVLIANSVADRYRWGGAVTVITLAVTLVVTLWASEVRPRTTKVIAALAAIASAVAVVDAMTGGGERDSWLTPMLAAVLVVGAPLAIVHRLRRHLEITMRTVMGALCVYLFVGLFFALLYGIVSSVGESAFFVQTDEPLQADFVYNSFVTLSTVGYGDLTAASDLGRMLSITEALRGPIYLVTIVALLVSNIGAARPARGGAPAALEEPIGQGDHDGTGGLEDESVA